MLEFVLFVSLLLSVVLGAIHVSNHLSMLGKLTEALQELPTELNTVPLSIHAGQKDFFTRAEFLNDITRGRAEEVSAHFPFHEVTRRFAEKLTRQFPDVTFTVEAGYILARLDIQDGHIVTSAPEAWPEIESDSDDPFPKSCRRWGIRPHSTYLVICSNGADAPSNSAPREHYLLYHVMKDHLRGGRFYDEGPFLARTRLARSYRRNQRILGASNYLEISPGQSSPTNDRNAFVWMDNSKFSIMLGLAVRARLSEGFLSSLLGVPSPNSEGYEVSTAQLYPVTREF